MKKHLMIMKLIMVICVVAFCWSDSTPAGASAGDVCGRMKDWSDAQAEVFLPDEPFCCPGTAPGSCGGTFPCTITMNGTNCSGTVCPKNKVKFDTGTYRDCDATSEHVCCLYDTKSGKRSKLKNCVYANAVDGPSCTWDAWVDDNNIPCRRTGISECEVTGEECWD